MADSDLVIPDPVTTPDPNDTELRRRQAHGLGALPNPLMPWTQAAKLVGYYESANDYKAGYSGGDVSQYPARPGYFGFPDWPGERGPQGITHAAGRYQFEPDTWKRYAGPLGITDFSPESQDKVFAAAFAHEGYGPWAPYNPRLRSALEGKGYGTDKPSLMAGASHNLPPQAMNLGPMLTPLQADPGVMPTPPVLPQDSLPEGYGAGHMIAMLGALGVFGSAPTHKFEPVSYDPWKVASAGQTSSSMPMMPNYAAFMGSQG